MAPGTRGNGEGPRRPASGLRWFLARLGDRSPAYLAGWALMVIAVSLALFALLGMVRLVGEPGIVPEVDLRVQAAIGEILSPETIRLMVWITALGGAFAMIPLTAALGVLLWLWGRWRELVELLIAVPGGAATVFLMKAFFQRARPVEALFEVRGLSFPSGHAFMSMVFFGLVIHLLLRSGLRPLSIAAGTVLALLLIGLIGVSRVYLGVHFLTDVVGGYAAGFLWLVLTLALVRLVERTYLRRAGGARWGLPRATPRGGS